MNDLHNYHNNNLISKIRKQNICRAVFLLLLFFLYQKHTEKDEINVFLNENKYQNGRDLTQFNARRELCRYT
ncbi:hypothetical protein [Capybara microvirus Cap1_SP_137]|nr:hypothetical protein [Capybara microvirus Cap1_SP_137]